MEAVLGTEGFKALADYEPLTTAQLDHIRNIVQNATMGAVEDAGKATKRDRYSGNARKKSSGQRNTSKI
jgi:SspJ family small acid-soluble spore protein